jgi:hypothetical protein
MNHGQMQKIFTPKYQLAGQLLDPFFCTSVVDVGHDQLMRSYILEEGMIFSIS